jgi:predicted  nucleic acid-binding Zn-ribbon protein
MAQSPDHEARITSLEIDVSGLRAELRDFREHNTRLHNATRQDIRDLRQDVTDTRQDVTDLRQDVTDLRQDVTDLRQDVTDLRQDVTDLRQDHTNLRSQVEAGFMEMRAKFDATAAGMQQIVGMLNTLIERDNQ